MDQSLQDLSDNELSALLTRYRESSGPCGIYARQIYEIEAELQQREFDLTLAIEPGRLIVKHRGIARIVSVPREESDARPLAL